MRTVTKETATSPPVYLAIDSLKHSQDAKSQLLELDCRCKNSYSLLDLEQSLRNETPKLLIISLEFDGQCALRYCQDHPLLLAKIPVVFFTADPGGSFEKALEAIRIGAEDVLTDQLDAEKLEHIAAIARRKLESYHTLANQADSIEPPLAGDRVGQAVDDISNISDSAQSIPVSACPASGSNSPSSDLPSSLRQTEQGVPATTAAIESSPYSHPAPVNDLCPRTEARNETQAARIKELETWILGTSPAMRQVRSIIAEVADTKANVMIYGASGTGKELVATAVHKLSNRAKGPFEPVNITEIPHELAESLLFGHERGAFTGADYRQIGVCEAADGGTLFLDEIGEMALATQPKLLRFLQESTVKRIGSRNAKKVDVRVITATNRAPETIAKAGMMREDLFFRLHVVPIHIPPLKDRSEDIEQLATLFLRRYVKAYDRSVEGFSEGALDILRRHDWPGNVRQLENVVERLVVFAKGRRIEVPDIPAEIHAASMFDEMPNGASRSDRSSVLTNGDSCVNGGENSAAAAAIASMSAIQRTERSAIVEALQRSGGHVIDAANLLGLGQATVYRKIKQYHIPHTRRRRRSPK